MNQLQSVSEWIESTRQRSALLDNDADALQMGIATLSAQSGRLAHTQKSAASVALYGHSQAAKAHLLAMLCANERGRLTVSPGEKILDYFSHINPGHLLTRMALRFSPHHATPDEKFPLRLGLISEAELVQLFIVHAGAQAASRSVDRAVIEARLHSWRALRQPHSVPGLQASDVAAIARFWRGVVPSSVQHIDDTLWYQFADLLPFLDLSTRASAWSLLWGEQQGLTQQWLALAQVLHQTGNARELAAPLSLLVDAFALPAEGFLVAESEAEGEVVVHAWTDNARRNAISLPIATLSLLTCELVLPCEHGALPGVDIIDIPAPVPQSMPPLWVSKCRWLLDRYRQHLQPDVLVVCNAVAERSQTPLAAAAFRQWVDETQPAQDASLPGLVWAITPQDDRFTRKRNLDEAVQQLLGNPGQRWGTLQALDAASVQRLLEWLAQATSLPLREARLQLLSERYQHQLRALMLPWLTAQGNMTDTDLAEMVKELQRHVSVQGEILADLLPDVTLFDALWHVQLSREEKVSELFNEVIDLFAEDTSMPQGSDVAQTTGQRAHLLWVQYLRQWSRQQDTARRLGLTPVTLQRLADCLIVTSYRLDLAGKLQEAIHLDRPCGAQLQAVVGNFIAWLGYTDVLPEQRPASRIAKGSVIFAPTTANLMVRLDRLGEQPVHAATRYVYDWLVALYTRATENQHYLNPLDITPADREQLKTWLN